MSGSAQPKQPAGRTEDTNAGALVSQYPSEEAFNDPARYALLEDIKSADGVPARPFRKFAMRAFILTTLTRVLAGRKFATPQLSDDDDIANDSVIDAAIQEARSAYCSQQISLHSARHIDCDNVAVVCTGPIDEPLLWILIPDSCGRTGTGRTLFDDDRKEEDCDLLVLLELIERLISAVVLLSAAYAPRAAAEALDKKAALSSCNGDSLGVDGGSSSFSFSSSSSSSSTPSVRSTTAELARVLGGFGDSYGFCRARELGLLRVVDCDYFGPLTLGNESVFSGRDEFLDDSMKRDADVYLARALALREALDELFGGSDGTPTAAAQEFAVLTSITHHAHAGHIYDRVADGQFDEHSITRVLGAAEQAPPAARKAVSAVAALGESILYKAETTTSELQRLRHAEQHRRNHGARSGTPGAAVVSAAAQSLSDTGARLAAWWAGAPHSNDRRSSISAQQQSPSTVASPNAYSPLAYDRGGAEQRTLPAIATAELSGDDIFIELDERMTASVDYRDARRLKQAHLNGALVLTNRLRHRDRASGTTIELGLNHEQLAELQNITYHHALLCRSTVSSANALQPRSRPSSFVFVPPEGTVALIRYSSRWSGDSSGTSEISEHAKSTPGLPFLLLVSFREVDTELPAATCLRRRIMILTVRSLLKGDEDRSPHLALTLDIPLPAKSTKDNKTPFTLLRFDEQRAFVIESDALPSSSVSVVPGKSMSFVRWELDQLRSGTEQTIQVDVTGKSMSQGKVGRQLLARAHFNCGNLTASGLRVRALQVHDRYEPGVAQRWVHSRLRGCVDIHS